MLRTPLILGVTCSSSDAYHTFFITSQVTEGLSVWRLPQESLAKASILLSMRSM